jgi:hypothetical protein
MCLLSSLQNSVAHVEWGDYEDYILLGQWSEQNLTCHDMVLL